MRRRISTLLFAVLAGIAGVVLIGLVVMSARLFEIQAELARLRDGALPRLVKLAQLSQDASATSSIAPALSTNPTRFEFETLLSRIKDKETSQRALLDELAALFEDEVAAQTLRDNGAELIDNLNDLTDVVRDQIEVSRRLDEYGAVLRDLLGALTPSGAAGGAPRAQQTISPGIAETAGQAALRILNMLLDPNRARFARNRDEIEASVQALAGALGSGTALPASGADPPLAAARRLVQSWSSEKDDIYADKTAALSNAFRIKALVEENSLIANRLLSSVNNAFWRASSALDTQIRLVNGITRFTLLAILLVVIAFAAGNVFVWRVLQTRVLRRLDRMRDALQVFAESRDRTLADPVPDEIGAISASLEHYMGVIDQRERELAEKSRALEQLSSQLAKYLSPQVYDSIFAGRQEVKVTSSRKKLTVFFSDIAGFTETADRLESEELTQLLNHYLTEMSDIALAHGATIDKYVGDAILIFFGDPETRGVRQDALACVEMAIAMRRRMVELDDIWRESGIEKPLRVRMGIHTGYCTVGNFGSEDRMDYTIIGGAVNTASRLESVATPGEVLISYETFALVKDRIFCEEHGRIEVRGIAYPVATYRVVDAHETLHRSRQRFRESHPNVTVDLDLDGMTREDRTQAATILRRALTMLAADAAPARAGEQSQEAQAWKTPASSRGG